MATQSVDVVAPPLRGVLISQRWCDLAFLHWFVPVDRVRGHLPPGTRPDVVDRGPYAGLTPVGLIPFQMVGAGFGRGRLAVPYLGTFWETNVRLYSVDDRGRRGIVFCSLDASRLAVVVAARTALGLPYRWASMRGAERRRHGARELAWTTRTRWPGPRGARSRIAVRVGEPVADDAPDAWLASFLTGRWGAHMQHMGRTRYVAVEHPPWLLHRAELLTLDGELLAAAGFPELTGRTPDHLLFAKGVEARFGTSGR